MSARIIECDRAAEIRTHLADVDDEVLEVLCEAKILPRHSYRLTGKPLGITGEVADYEAVTKLGLKLHSARQAGYDATTLRIKITTLCRQCERAMLNSAQSLMDISVMENASCSQ